VCESHIVFFLANQFMKRTMIPGVKSAFGKLRFSAVSRTEYESVRLLIIMICTHTMAT
jgi:hypothetical protein